MHINRAMCRVVAAGATPPDFSGDYVLNRQAST